MMEADQRTRRETWHEAQLGCLVARPSHPTSLAYVAAEVRIEQTVAAMRSDQISRLRPLANGLVWSLQGEAMIRNGESTTIVNTSGIRT